MKTELLKIVKHIVYLLFGVIRLPKPLQGS